MKRKIMQVSVLLALALCATGCKTAKSIIDSRVYVPEEGGINFVKVTDETKEQITPNIAKEMGRLTWWANPYMAFTKDGRSMASSTRRKRRSKGLGHVKTRKED